jgi:hypothetical protein
MEKDILPATNLHAWSKLWISELEAFPEMWKLRCVCTKIEPLML